MENYLLEYLIKLTKPMDKDLKKAITEVTKVLSRKLLVIIGKLSDENETPKKEYANLWVDCFKLASDINSLIEIRDRQDSDIYEKILERDMPLPNFITFLRTWQGNADIELVLRRK